MLPTGAEALVLSGRAIQGGSQSPVSSVTTAPGLDPQKLTPQAKDDRSDDPSGSEAVTAGPVSGSEAWLLLTLATRARKLAPSPRQGWGAGGTGTPRPSPLPASPPFPQTLKEAVSSSGLAVLLPCSEGGGLGAPRSPKPEGLWAGCSTPWGHTDNGGL